MKELLEKNLPELLRFSTAMSGNKTDAEDLVHNAIEKILKNYPQIADNTEFLKISYRVIRNSFIDLKRKKIPINEDIGNIEYKNTLDIDETIKFKTMSPEQKLIDNEIIISKYKRLEIAQGCLSELENETQKSVLTLFSEGLKYDQIAKRLDIPKGTVMSGLARARLKVIDCIKRKLNNE